jgi:hypothetical protein
MSLGHLAGCAGLLSSVVMITAAAQEPEWSPDAIEECDRACLVEIMACG